MHPKNTPNTTCNTCGTRFWKNPKWIREQNYCSHACYYSRDRRIPIDNGDGTASVPLTKGFTAIVDIGDAARVARYSWHAKTGTHGTYALARIGNVLVRLHRYILEPPDDMEIDHINGDGLDNRRQNLRICSHGENMRNIKNRSGRAAKYKGIGWDARRGKWRARIKDNGRERWLGYFSTDIDAARAYDAAARRLYGEFAHLNLPDD